MFENPKHSPVLWSSIACFRVLIWHPGLKVAGEGLPGTRAGLLVRAAGSGATGGSVCPATAGLPPARIPWGLGRSGPSWSLVGLVRRRVKLLIPYLVDIIPVFQIFFQFRKVFLLGRMMTWGVRKAGGRLGLFGNVGLRSGMLFLFGRRVSLVSFLLGSCVP